MNNLTSYEKVVLYNMVFDRLYSIKMQSAHISEDVYKQYLEVWEKDLGTILEKLKQQGWNGNDI